eukprot:407248-Amphidinium_carterae.1
MLNVSTWNARASKIWKDAVEQAEQDHTRYLSMTPSERVVDRGTHRSGRWNLPHALGSTESLMRAELLEILPKN